MKYYFTIFLILFYFQTVSSKDGIYIYDINSENYPKVSLKFYNEINSQSKELKKENINLFNNFNPITEFSSLKVQDNPNKKNLFVFALDLSGSVNKEKIKLYQSFISNFINLVDFGSNRVAITGFNDYPFVIQSPTNSKDALLNSLNITNNFGTSNFTNAFSSEFNVISFTNKPDEKYTVILLNDGGGIFDENLIKNSLIQKESNLYSISFLSENPTFIKSICKGFNCLFFDNIKNVSESEYYSEIIYFHSSGFRPHHLEVSVNSCEQINRIVLINTDNGISDGKDYLINKEDLPYLEIEPISSHSFGVVQPGLNGKKGFDIIPRNDDILVTDIIDYPEFKLNGISKNKILRKDEIYHIEIVFLPKDTLYIFRKIKLVSDACLDLSISISGGKEDINNLPNNLNIVQPNGGEFIDVSRPYRIVWDGILPLDTVTLEMSRNNGLNWELISNKGVNLSYNWENIPNITTNSALLRIKNYAKEKKSNKIKSLTGVNGNVVSLVWSNDNKQLFTGSGDGFIRLWDVATAEPIRTIYGGIKNLAFMDISNDEELIAFIDENRKLIQIVDIQNSFLVQEYLAQQNFTALDWSANSSLLVAGTEDGYIYMWEYPNDSSIFKIKTGLYAINSIHFSPNGDKIGVGTDDGRVLIYNTSGELLHILKNSDVAVTDITWNKSNQVIAVSSLVEQVKIWDIESETNVLNINDLKKPVNLVSWDPNLLFIVTVNADKMINLWKPQTGNLHYSFNFHKNQISSMNWSNDGQSIASGGDQGEIFIWSIKDIPFENIVLQSDTSEAVFTLLKPDLQLANVHFGNQIINKEIDSTVNQLIFNKGLLPIIIDSVKITGDTRQVFQAKDFINNSLIEPGKSIGLKLSYTPDSQIFNLDSISVYSGNFVFRSIVSGIGNPAKVRLTPEALFFPETNLGDSAQSQKVILENLTSSSLEFEDYYYEFQKGFKIENFDTSPLLPFELREYNISFVPQISGEISAINYFRFIDVPSKIYLTLNGKSIAPQIQFAEKLDLSPLICYGDSSEALIKLFNIGNSILQIDSLELLGNQSEFVILSGNIKTSLNPGDSTYLSIYFKSDEIGFKQATIRIYTNINENKKKEHNILILAKREKLDYNFSDVELNYFVDENQKSAKILRVYNTSTFPLIFLPEIENNNFNIKTSIPVMILPNDSSDIEIEYSGSPIKGIFKSEFQFVDTCGKISLVHLSAFVGMKNAKIQTVDFVNFGEIDCDSLSKSNRIIFSNSGESPLVIDKVLLDGADKNDFDLLKLNSNQILQKGEFDTLLVRVNTQKIGDLKANIKIYSNADNSTDGYIEVTLNAFIAEKSIESSVDTLSMDNLYENKSYRSDFEITNTGNTAIEWTYPVNLTYFIIDSIVPKITPRGAKSKFYITFKGGKTLNYYTEEILFNNLCDKSKRITLSAIVNRKAAVGIQVGKVNAASGDTILVPIYLLSIDGQEFPKVDNYIAELYFNATLLMPIDQSSTVDNNLVRKMEIELNPYPDADGIVANIRLKAFLGNSDSTTLLLLNSKAIGNDNLVIEELNGVFFLDSICYDGGARLIGSTGVLKLNQNLPNPAYDITRIKFSIIESGTYKLEFYDLIGNICKKIQLPNLKYGDYEISVDLGAFSIGNYFYILRTPSGSLIRKLTINR